MVYQSQQKPEVAGTGRLRIVKNQDGQSRYLHFGTLLQSLRNRVNLTQDEITDALSSVFD